MKQGRHAETEWTAARKALHKARLDEPGDQPEVVEWRERYPTPTGPDDTCYVEALALVREGRGRWIACGDPNHPAARALTYGPESRRSPPTLADLPMVDHIELARAAKYLRALADALDLVQTGKPRGKRYEGNATYDLALAWYLWTGGAIDVYRVDLDDEFDERGNSRVDPEVVCNEALANDSVTLPPRADEGLDGQEAFDRWNAKEIVALLGPTVEALLRRERREGSRPYLARYDSLARFRGGRSVFAQYAAIDAVRELEALKQAAQGRHGADLFPWGQRS